MSHAIHWNFQSCFLGEDAQDRSDRKILMPWVKFLWESYCQCLELLRTNVRVERLYHDIAQQAFRFCLKYQVTNHQFSHHFLCQWCPQCLKITKKVSFDSLRLHFEWTKVHYKMPKIVNFGEFFWKPETSGQTLLPDMSL